jgi:hypothetical protein
MANDLTTAALSLVLQHQLTGCTRAGHSAATLLERLAGNASLDAHTRELCERMSDRLCDGEEGPA